MNRSALLGLSACSASATKFECGGVECGVCSVYLVTIYKQRNPGEPGGPTLASRRPQLQLSYKYYKANYSSLARSTQERVNW